MSLDAFAARAPLDVGERRYQHFSLPRAAANGAGDVARLPVSLKVLLENLLRSEDGVSVTADDIAALAGNAGTGREIAYRPARVLMQDFTGVPAVADLAAMRNAVAAAGKDPAIVNPLSPVDLVIDHSVMVDRFGDAAAFRRERRLGDAPQPRALPISALGTTGVRQPPPWCRLAPASATK